LVGTVVFVLFAAVFADGLRASSGRPEWLVTDVAAAGVAVLVFGSLVTSHWRRQSSTVQAV
jgi:hypothetical protein